jgi:hypothetical protein
MGDALSTATQKPSLESLLNLSGWLPQYTKLTYIKMIAKAQSFKVLSYQKRLRLDVDAAKIADERASRPQQSLMSR